MNEESIIAEMFAAGVQYGHNKRFSNPANLPFIYETRNKMQIFDLVKSEKLLAKALEFVGQIASNNGQILFVATKKQARPLVKAYAQSCDMPYVDTRWLGGTLTNYASVRNSIKHLSRLEELRDNNGFIGLTKKEISKHLNTIDKLQKVVGGIRGMKGVPSAMFIIDAKTERNAIDEAKCLHVPVVAVVDSNSSPDQIDYIIPGNDDSIKSIEFYLKAITGKIIEVQKEHAFKEAKGA